MFQQGQKSSKLNISMQTNKKRRRKTNFFFKCLFRNFQGKLTTFGKFHIITFLILSAFCCTKDLIGMQEGRGTLYIENFETMKESNRERERERVN